MYEILKRANFSDEDAQGFVDEVVSVVSQRFDDKKELLASKQDINRLEGDIQKLDAKLQTEIANLRAEMHREFQNFALKIAGFLVAQAAVIVTLIKLL